MTLAFQPDEALANPDFSRMTPEALLVCLTRVPTVLHLYGSTADLLRARIHGGAVTFGSWMTAPRGWLRSRALIGSELAPLLVRADARQHLEQESRGVGCHRRFAARHPRHGDGRSGLARSFFSAHARGLLASLRATQPRRSRRLQHLGREPAAQWRPADLASERDPARRRRSAILRRICSLSAAIRRCRFSLGASRSRPEAIEALKKFCDAELVRSGLVRWDPSGRDEPVQCPRRRSRITTRSPRCLAGAGRIHRAFALRARLHPRTIGPSSINTSAGRRCRNGCRPWA